MLILWRKTDSDNSLRWLESSTRSKTLGQTDLEGYLEMNLQSQLSFHGQQEGE